MSNTAKLPTNQELYLQFKEFVKDFFIKELARSFEFISETDAVKTGELAAEVIVARPDPEVVTRATRAEEQELHTKATAAFNAHVLSIWDAQGDDFDEPEYSAKIEELGNEAYMELQVHKRLTMKKLIDEQMGLVGKGSCVTIAGGFGFKGKDGKWTEGSF